MPWHPNETFITGRASRTAELIDGAARPGGSELALFNREGQDIEQAGDTILECLEQSLFLQRRNVEMEAEKINQVGVAQALLLDQPVPGRLCVLAEKADQQVVQRGHLGRFQPEQAAARWAPLDFGLPVGAHSQFALDLELADSLELQVVAAIGELLQRGDASGAAD